MVLEIDKLIISYQILTVLYWPNADCYTLNDIPSKMKAFIYVHINMFEVVYNYYIRRIRSTP